MGLGDWLRRKWQEPDEGTARAYLVFTTSDGQRVLQHWMDSVYCTVYEGTDPLELAYHNGRRSVIHEVLQAVQYAESPSKAEVKVQTEEEGT